MNNNLAMRYRIPMLMTGFASLLCGMYIGLIRLGWNLPLQSAVRFESHGALMVCGFLGTVICLERAVAIGERWAYAGALASAAGAMVLIAGTAPWLGALLATVASSILIAASARIYLKQCELFTLTLLLAALCWCLGCILWLAGFSLSRVVPWWLCFLILTIVGERLELSRFLRPARGSRALFIFSLLLFIAGASVASFGTSQNFQLLSASFIALSLWLARNDIVRRTIRQQGLTRFIAAALACGYVWLFAAGCTGLVLPQLIPGSSYDAYMHAVFLGFVFSMIFGHAPIIFPAISKIRIPYHTSFYLPLLMLQLSVLIRVCGDLLYVASLRKAGGIMHVAAIMLFMATLAGSVIFNKNDKNNIG